MEGPTEIVNNEDPIEFVRKKKRRKTRVRKNKRKSRKIIKRKKTNRFFRNKKKRRTNKRRLRGGSPCGCDTFIGGSKKRGGSVFIDPTINV
tara:strand:+ start:1205 stop:1477 length:273 start_codon:yes stop_codon:yes gene_type:complete